MDKINKAAAAGIVFFSVILVGFVGIKIDQTTIGLLAGAFIGLAVSIPTTALIMIVGLRDTSQPRPTPPPEQSQDVPVLTTHNHYYQHNTINVYTSRAPHTMTPFQICSEVATALRVSRYEAERRIAAGEVKLLPPPNH